MMPRGKLTSPPAVPMREDVVQSSSDGQRKRVTGPMMIPSSSEWKHDMSVDMSPQKRFAPNEEELCDLLAPTSSTQASMVHIGRWRIRLRDVLLALAIGGGMMALGLVFHRHNHSERVRLEYSDDTEYAFLAPLNKDGRAAAIEALDNQLEDLSAHEVRRSVNGQLNTTIRVTAKYFNSGPIAFWTRAYEHSIPGPLWSVQPGDTINYEIINELEPNVQGNWTENTYHNPNSTNIHLHGMHVDPTGIADNVLREANPGETLFSQVHVPKNHPRGLYHYHPHYHGSIYVQLAGGMSGPILVEDDDTTLPDEYKTVKTHILALQEFNFEDLRDINVAARSKLQHREQYTTKTLLDAQVRALYPDVQLPSRHLNMPLSTSLKAELSYAQSKAVKHLETPDISRFFTVNGQFLPKIDVQPHENVRLRLLNGGASALLELSIPGCTLHQIAADGIFFSTPPRLMDVLLLSPGARAEIVVNCQPNDPSAGPAGETLRPFQSMRHKKLDYFVGATSDLYRGVLGFIRVSGASRKMPVVKTTPPPPTLYATDDLQTLAPIDATTLEPFPFVFSMDTKIVLKDGFPYKTYFVNHQVFNMTSIRDLKLDRVQEWIVVNERDEPKGDGTPGMLTFNNHPFHLHTNAFQVIAMSHGEGVDYKVGDWRDVIAIPTPGNVTIRFRPVDFRGPTLAHCHAAAHSDAGMLALAMIV